ncbi:unnamed protein product [Parnassius apollo]|uniref:Methionine synthase reductase n=1 Tax=Parnassius apollo TaxID=110799 RepID=A0A8S3W1J3_PARAO|nr:unnamed protein product [Parnassius apollo]
MTVLYNLCDIFDNLCQQTTLSLPPLKHNYLKIEFENSDNNETVYHGQAPTLPFAASEVYDVPMCNWRHLTVEHADCKAVYEVTFDISSTNLSFCPGDTIGLIPKNLDAEVDFVIDHLDLTSIVDCSYTITVDHGQKGARTPAHVPVKSRLRHVLTHCVDIRAVVKKLFLLALSRYTKDEREKMVLEYLCSKEGSPAYTTHILNKNLCILDLFAIFKTCKPPIEVVLEHLPRLLPRPYSIVNSALANSNLLKICFSVMNIGNNRKGLVTGWLEQIIKEPSLEDLITNINLKDDKVTLVHKVPIYLRKNINQFSFPEVCTSPLLLIGPGTGVAPYIGLLEQKEYQGNKDLGMIWLFFGCRNPNLDFIYKKELENFVSKGVLNKLTTSFSRWEGCNSKKYIQESILQNGEEVSKLLKEGAKVYICGNVRTMAAQVKETLVKCLVEYTSNTQEEAEKFISNLQKNKRYLVDSWN